MESAFDDTLPPSDEVERDFLTHANDDLSARMWLEDRGIDPAPIVEHVDKIALLQCCSVWVLENERYRLLMYPPDHVGPKYPPALAIPITEQGLFVDLLLINDDMSFARATCRTAWLGRANLALPVVRLHAHPLDWLESGCAGVCHIEPISRRALKELADAETIECSDIHTALEAWDWGFDGNDSEKRRFDIDDTPGIVSYIEDEVRWRVLHRLGKDGLPVGPDPKFDDPDHDALIEKMRSEYVTE